MLRNIEILFFIAFIFFYFFFFSSGALKRINYNGLFFYQNINATNITYKKKNLKQEIEFKNLFHLSSKRLVYFDDNYNISYSLKLKNKSLATISYYNYILYQKVGDTFSFYNTKGEKYWTMESKSYPYLSKNGERIAFISTDNSFFSIYDKDMNPILKDKSYGAMMTDFQFCDYENSFLVSYSNGQLIYFNSNGKIVFQEDLAQSHSSQYNYIKSTSISETGLYIGVIANLYPERVIVWNREGVVIKNKESRFSRRQKNNFFIDEYNEVLVDYDEKEIYIDSLKREKLLKKISFEKKISNVLSHSLQNYLFLLITLENSDSFLYFLHLENDQLQLLDKLMFKEKGYFYYLQAKETEEKKYILLQNMSEFYIIYMKI